MEYLFAAIALVNREKNCLENYMLGPSVPIGKVEKMIGLDLSKVSVPLSAKENLVVRTVLTGKPQYTRDLYDYARPIVKKPLIVPIQKMLGIKLIGTVPLVAKGEVIGVLSFARKIEELLTDEEMEILRAFANHAGLAIERAMNITEFKRAEETLQASEEKYRALIENANEVVAVVQDGMVKYVNPRVIQLSDYSKEDIFSRPIDWEGKPATLNFLTDITERRKAEDQVKASLKEKEMLLKEIHHRVKNNLQVISSLLNLEIGYIKNKQALKRFEECQDRVRTIALIHEKLSESGDLARINFAEYIQSLVADLRHSYEVNPEAIKLKINIDDVLLDVDTAIPCGLIVNELVSNSLKHAFPAGREGEIRIEACSDNDKFTLIVSDNGVGFPKDLDFRSTKTLGLQLVCTLVDQLGGSIELDRSGGTEFKITFTKVKYEERD